MTSGAPERPRLAFEFRSRTALLAAAVAFLCGCGDGGSDSAATAQAPGNTTPSPSAANSAPTITGTPPSSVTGGTTYSFKPTASDADGDALSFGILGRPAWAAFNSSTGRLNGTPTQNDLGATAPVTISVTDGAATATLATFTIQVVGTASGAASLVWAPPTENEDGSPLVDLAGYKLYWGTEEGDYPNSVTLMNPGLTRYVVEDLTPATWHFVMTAVTTRGLESDYSNLQTQAVRL